MFKENKARTYKQSDLTRVHDQPHTLASDIITKEEIAHDNRW